MKISICVFAVVAFFQLCCARIIDLTGICHHSNVDGERIKETYLNQPEHFCVYAKFLNGTELYSCEEADWLNKPKKVLPDFPVNECVSGPGFEAFLKCDCAWCNGPCTVGQTRCGKPTKTPITTTTMSTSSISVVSSTTSAPTTTATSAITTEQSVTPISLTLKASSTTSAPTTETTSAIITEQSTITLRASTEITTPQKVKDSTVVAPKSRKVTPETTTTTNNVTTTITASTTQATETTKSVRATSLIPSSPQDSPSPSTGTSGSNGNQNNGNSESGSIRSIEQSENDGPNKCVCLNSVASFNIVAATLLTIIAYLF